MKDLRAESDPSIGIKRVHDFLPADANLTVLQFFDSASSSSPNKKRRVSTSEEDEAIQDPVATLPPQSDALENTKPTSSRMGKPESKSRQLPSEREMHTCPVCQSKVPTENDAFNAHLDSCLSRDAIRQARAEVMPASPKQGDIWERWTKMAPGSRKKTRI